MKRITFLIFGFICAILGVLGVLLPVLPGIIFFVAAAFFFSHSSEKLQRALYRIPYVGESILEWDTQKRMSMKSKVSLLGLFLGMAVYPYLLENKAYAIIMTNFFFIALFCVMAVGNEPEKEGGTKSA